MNKAWMSEILLDNKNESPFKWRTMQKYVDLNKLKLFELKSVAKLLSPVIFDNKGCGII